MVERIFSVDFRSTRTIDSLERLLVMVGHPDAQPQADGSLKLYGLCPVPPGGLNLDEVMTLRDTRPRAQA